MQTMKEIAEALNRAAEFFDEHGRPSEGSDFADLASKVEQMRCETCRYYYTRFVMCGQYAKVSSDCLEGYASKNPSQNFGCWHWEEKEVKNG